MFGLLLLLLHFLLARPMTDKRLPVNTAPSFQSDASLTILLKSHAAPFTPSFNVENKMVASLANFCPRTARTGKLVFSNIESGGEGGNAAPKPYATMRACIYWQTFIRHQYPGQSKSLLRNLVAVVVGGVGVGSGAGGVRANV